LFNRCEAALDGDMVTFGRFLGTRTGRCADRLVRASTLTTDFTSGRAA